MQRFSDNRLRGRWLHEYTHKCQGKTMTTKKKAKPTPKKTPKKAGRPSKLKTIDVEQLKKLVIKGFTNFEIANFFRINMRTFQRYLAADEKFSHTLKGWKEGADARVERSLYERANGYSHESEEVFCAFGKVTRVSIVKHYPPDPLSCIFWLKNRKPNEYRDKPLEAEDEDLKDTQLIFGSVPRMLTPTQQGFIQN